MTDVKDMRSLTQALTETLNELQNGKVENSYASTVSKLSGRIIGTCKIQLDYNKYMKYKNEIPFMESAK